MATITESLTTLPGDWSIADLLERVDVPAARIRLLPAPGTATSSDVLQIARREKRLFELVDGILVEKVMGIYESFVAGLILHWIHDYLEVHDLGQAFGADGAMRILGRQVRIPDVSFVSWERRGRGRLAPIPDLAPNLAVEILSEGNTAAEMERKLQVCFEAGVELVWYIDPATRSAWVHRSDATAVRLGETDELSGGDVLPDLSISLRELFVRADAEQSND